MDASQTDGQPVDATGDTVSIPPICPSPQFSPPPGNIVFGRYVSIAAPGLPPNGTIFYTADGTVPTRSSAAYDGGPLGPIWFSTTFVAISSTLGATCDDSQYVIGAYTVIDAPEGGM
jgi:hypothetical protein